MASGIDQGRWPDRSRRVLELAAEEARLLRSNDIGTGHLLAGMLTEGECMAARVLGHLGLTLEMAREDLGTRALGRPAVPGRVSVRPLSPRLKRALEQGSREAVQLGHTWVGTEHLLLGIISDDRFDAAAILSRHGVTPADVRKTVLRVLGAADEPPAVSAPPPPTLAMVQTAAFVARADEGDGHGDIGRELRDLDGLVSGMSGAWLEGPPVLGAALAGLVMAASRIAQMGGVDLGAEVAARLGAVNDGSDDEGTVRP
jgi:ATP-dependent Clp protease ATP-binding subunit ClpA